jgi:hypothetical protein
MIFLPGRCLHRPERNWNAISKIHPYSGLVSQIHLYSAHKKMQMKNGTLQVIYKVANDPVKYPVKEVKFLIRFYFRSVETPTRVGQK